MRVWPANAQEGSLHPSIRCAKGFPSTWSHSALANRPVYVIARLTIREYYCSLKMGWPLTRREREGHGMSKGNRWRLWPVGDVSGGMMERYRRREREKREKKTQSYREVSVFIKTPVLSQSLVTLSDDSVSVRKRKNYLVHVRQ